MGRATGKRRLSRVLTSTKHPRRGVSGEESQDYGYNFANQRRRSNSSTQALGDFKTKFEANEQDPVFEEELHGPTDDDMEHASTISKEESIDSTLEGSGHDEDDVVHKKL